MRAPAPPALAGAEGRVLIVDDDQALCETLAVWLVRRGFSVEWRTSAEAALALVEQQELDVVVTDLHLGEMDGLALCERVLALRPGLPVVITTGFGTREHRAAALRAGAHGFMTKPYELDALRAELIRAVLTSRAARARSVPS